MPRGEEQAKRLRAWLRSRRRPSPVYSTAWQVPELNMMVSHEIDYDAVDSSGVRRWPDRVEIVLRESGWFVGRQVDVERWRRMIARHEGLHMHAAAETFLREFGGLRVGYFFPSGRPTSRSLFKVDPELPLPACEVFEEWCAL